MPSLPEVLFSHLALPASRHSHHHGAGRTSAQTTAPAAMNASSPISTPGTITTPPPTRQARRNFAPLFAWSAQCRPIVSSLAVTTPGRDEHVVLDQRVRGDVAVGLDPDPLPIVTSLSIAVPRPMTVSRRSSLARGRAPGRR